MELARKARAGVLVVLAWAILAVQARPATAAAAAPTLVATADAEGHTTPCASCPAHAGMGGLDRRATALAKLRAEAGPLLLVDTGNWLVGTDSVATRGRVLVGAYEALKYDVVNVGTKDFYWGKAPTLELLKAAKFDVVSANLLDEQTGAPLLKPFVVKDVGGEKVGVIGVCEPPPGLELLPELRAQLAGIRIRPVVETLAEWMPKVRAESARVIVLYYGTGRGLRAVRAALAGTPTVILTGGIQLESLASDGDPPAFTAEEHGKSLARVSLDPKPAVSQVMMTPEITGDEMMRQLVASYAIADAAPPAALAPATAPAVGPTAVAANQPPPATQPETTTPPTAPPPPSQPPAEQPKPQPFMQIRLGGGGNPPAATEPTTPPPPPVEPPASQVATTAPATTTTAVATTAPATTAHTRPTAITSPLVPIKPALEPKGLAGVGLTAQQVNAAIDKGNEYLWNHLKTKVLPFGPLGSAPEHILACYALVHAGAAKKYPEFDAALRDFLERVDPRSPYNMQTYQQGVLCMLIEAYGDPAFYPKMRVAARRLLEEQGADGTWDYGWDVPAAAFDEENGPPLQVLGGIPLDGSKSQLVPWKRNVDWSRGKDGDNSTTQFALLGLSSAARLQVILPQGGFARAVNGQMVRQCQDGGWGYEFAYGGYGSMTCAGVCSLAIARHAAHDADPEIEKAIGHGLGWLDKNFSVETNPNSGSYHYYYLYSLERVGRILETEFVGTHEWYPLGAKYLVGAQKPDGRWIESSADEDPIQAVSFALLFLTRATPKLDLVVERGGAGTLKTAAAIPTRRLYIILDASGSMMETMEGRLKFDVAREAVASVVKAMPANSEMGLRVYGHRKRATEEGADEDTELLIPMGKLDKQEFSTKLAGLRPRGKTPMAKSLTEAKTDIANAARDGSPVAVLLLTDGGEDTIKPRGNPVKAARELGTLKNVRFHILGFDINQQDWGVQLQQMVDAGHGTYWRAQHTDEVLKEIRAAALGLPENFFVYDADGHQVDQGEFGESRTLKEGKYVVKTNYAGRAQETSMWVNTGRTTALVFDAGKAGDAPAAGPVAAGSGARPQTQPANAAAVQPTGAAQPGAGPKFCTHCGAPLGPGAKFCTKCGSKVGS